MPEFCLVELLTWRIHCMRAFVLSRTFSCSSPDNWKAWRTLKAHSSTDTSTCWRCVTELLWLTCSTGALVTVNWIWSQVVRSKYSEEFNLSFYKICGVVLCCPGSLIATVECVELFVVTLNTKRCTPGCYNGGLCITELSGTATWILVTSFAEGFALCVDAISKWQQRCFFTIK